MYPVNELKTPQQRIKACLCIAVVIHVLGLIGIHMPALESASTPPASLDLLLIPLNETSSKPASPSVSSSKPPGEQAQHMSLAKTPHKNQHSFRKQRKPTKKRTISANHHEPQDAEYLARWQARIEDIGNQHYPEEEQIKNLKGSLRLMVALNKDGSVKEINLRQSSGHTLLDQAAIQIVQKAAPFEPLPQLIAKDIDVLEIIRTWQFKGEISTNS